MRVPKGWVPVIASEIVEELINKDIIASEVIRALSGSIGLIIVIPITVFISASMFNRRYIRRRK